MIPPDSSLSIFKNVLVLGPQIGLHIPKPSKRWRGLIFGLILSGGGILAVIAGIGYVFYQTYRFGPAVQERTIEQALVPAAIIGLIMIVIGLLVLWSAYRNWNHAAAVYRDGFVLSNRAGLHTLRWMEVASITSAVTKHYTNGVYTGTTHVYTILDRQGKKVILNDAIPDVEALADAIQKGSFAHLYRTAAEEYNGGRPVQFGPVAISKEGITIGKKDYAWDAVGQVTVEKGYLKVAQKGGGWFSGGSAPAASIPNLPVLLSILDQVRRPGS